jgi:hypothetical protein
MRFFLVTSAVGSKRLALGRRRSEAIAGAEQLESVHAQDLLLPAELVASLGGKASPDGDWACGTLLQQAMQRNGPGWTDLPALLPWPPTKSPSSMQTKA